MQTSSWYLCAYPLWIGNVSPFLLEVMSRVGWTQTFFKISFILNHQASDWHRTGPSDFTVSSQWYLTSFQSHYQGIHSVLTLFPFSVLWYPCQKNQSSKCWDSGISCIAKLPSVIATCKDGLVVLQALRDALFPSPHPCLQLATWIKQITKKSFNKV